MSWLIDRSAGLVACVLGVLIAGCASVSEPQGKPQPAGVSEFEVGRTTRDEVLRQWGAAQSDSAFSQGHRVLHYYRPHAGMSLLSALPGTDAMSTERGRPAREWVLLFDRNQVLRQILLRGLPADPDPVPR